MKENISDNFNWTMTKIVYGSLDLILKELPLNPGFYKIYTDAPEYILQTFNKRDDSKHYNIGKKVTASKELPQGYRILQEKDNPYIVYTGHSFSLRQRAREHFKGSRGTGCLAIFQLIDLRGYNWYFSYLETSTLLDEKRKDSKLFRTYLEQKLRSQLGWPILCSQ